MDLRAYEEGECIVRGRRLRAADGDCQVVARHAGAVQHLGDKPSGGTFADWVAIGEGRAAGLLLLLHLFFSIMKSDNRGEGAFVLCFGVRLLRAA